VTVQTGPESEAPSFHIRAEGANARVTEDVDHALKGESPNVDARHVQPYLTHKLARTVGATLSLTPGEGAVELKGGR
jgi:histidine phosphotransferase ChpT